MENIQETIKVIVKHFLSDPLNNNLLPEFSDPAFDKSLVGFCRGDDPVFSEIKNHIGSFYWTPSYIFKKTFPDIEFTPENLAVISWILPQTKLTKKENRKSVRYPGKRWSLVRHYGEIINENLRKHLIAELKLLKIHALAPQLSPFWQRKDSINFGYASTWSERHAAFACGLGTFGLSDGLITPVGKAVRVGSVIAKAEIGPVERPYTDHHSYCLFYISGKCGKCILRCPAKAISEHGHDKVKCKNYIRNITSEYVNNNQLGFEVNSCGLCQTKVPCESGIPVKH